MVLLERGLDTEFHFKASRSSGAGGQNVNKVSTKMELRFSITESKILTEEEKRILLGKLSAKLNQDNELIVVSQVERTQLKNKKLCIEKFYRIISKALKPKRNRVPTQPSEESIEKRMESKRQLSEKKVLRQKPKP
jgi:ribosome-associated protein